METFKIAAEFCLKRLASDRQVSFFFLDAWCYISRFLYSVFWPRKCADSGSMTVISDNYVSTIISAEKLGSPAISWFLIADYVS